MSVQAGTTSVSRPSAVAGGVAPGAANAAVPPSTKSTLNYSAGIVLVALVLLWLLGGIVFRGR